MHGPVRQDSGIHRALEIWGRRWWLGALVLFATLIPALSFVLFLPDIYRASATVLVERQQVSETLVRPSITEEVETRLHAISEEVLSRSNLQDLITRFDLYPGVRKKASIEAAIQRLRRDIDLDLKGVERSWGRGATVAFALGYRGRDPGQVAAVANALASFYVETNLAARERQAERTAVFLKSQLEEMKTKLQHQEGLVGAFERRHAGELPQQVEANLASLERLNAQLQLNSEKQIRVMERRDHQAEFGGAGTSAAQPDPERAEARLLRLNEELRDLRRRYSDKYPDVVRLEREIAELEVLAAERGPEPDAPQTGGPDGAGAPPPGRSRRGADGELGALKEEEDRLRRTIADYERRIESAPHRQQEFQALSRDYETTRELYDSLLKRYEEALLAESMEHGRATEQFRILDPAVTPRDPAAPNRIWLSLVALILSVGMAVGGMALAEQLDTSFHSLDSLRAFTRVPVLASIPRIVTRGDVVRRMVRVGGVMIAVAIGVAAAAGASYYIAREYEPLVLILSGGRV